MPVPRFPAIRASLGASAIRQRIIGRVEQAANHTHAHGRPAAIVIDEQSAPRLAMAVGEVWGADDAGGDGALPVTRKSGKEARREHVISASLVATALILGLWGGRWQAENSAQVGAHAGPPGGWLTESPRRAHPMFGAGAATSSGAGDPTMRPTSSLTAAALATTINAAMAAGALAGDAVQWRVEDGGNGHWYQFFETANPRTWQAARDWAYTTGGHLVTITTAQEQAFIISIAPAYEDESGGQAWLGGYQDLNAPDYAEPHGGWRWITGEPMNYQPWVNAGQSSPGSDFLTLGRDFLGRFGWNDIWTDYFGGRKFCFVEHDTDCNNDGIVDFGQMRDGTLPDANSNGVPDCCESGKTCCIGDIYIDGRINGADLGIVLSEWGPVTPTTNSDLDGNGRVDGADLGLLLSHWGPCGG